MDDQHSMLSFLADSTPTGPPADDALLFFLSSSTTELDELQSHSKRPDYLEAPTPRHAHPVQGTVAQIDSLMDTETVPLLSQITAPREEPKAMHLNLLSPSLDTKLEPDCLLQPSTSQLASSSGSDHRTIPCTDAGKTSSRLGGKKRPLHVMQAIAKRNAPNASLSDGDLAQIGLMHESEAQLAESRELYSALISFKKCLAAHGYRINSLYLDAISTPDVGATMQKPFAFVLNKNQQPASLPHQICKVDDLYKTSGSHQEVTGNRRSDTMSTCESSLETETAGLAADGESPLKRVRITRGGESSSSGQRISCAVCSKKMADFSNLVRHFRHVHQELKPFKCPKCRGFYSSEGTLWHHISNVHMDSPRTHKCEYCDASYDSCGAKTRHVHGTHHMEKPLYKCLFQDCKRVFVFPAHLEAHAAEEHEGFRPFPCEECPKSFSSSNGLVRHCREVHRTEKAYTCPQCGTGLTKRCHLKRHLINVHRLSLEVVDEEMKKHPNPGDVPATNVSTIAN